MVSSKGVLFADICQVMAGSSPLTPRSGIGEGLLDVLVVQDQVAFEIQRKDLTWSEAALLDDAVVVQLNRADFGAGDDEAFGSNLVAARPQAIAIQRGADEATIGERQPRWAVPRLDHRRAEPIQGLHPRREPGPVLPRRRHEHPPRRP